MKRIGKITRYLLFVAAMTTAVAACGKKGPLIPPEALVPASIKDLRVTQQGERFLVTWSQPSREEAGRPLQGLAGFRLFRREVLPAGEDCEECTGAYRLLVNVDLEYPQGVVRNGSLFSFTDVDLETGKTYQYKIVSFKTDGAESKQSNLARRKKVTPPLPPVIAATPSETEITLTWQPVAAPPKGSLLGYLVYRGTGDSPLLSLRKKPFPETVFEDLGLERGVKYRYTVTAVAQVEGETVESDPSAAATGELSGRE